MLRAPCSCFKDSGKAEDSPTVEPRARECLIKAVVQRRITACVLGHWGHEGVQDFEPHTLPVIIKT